jgi:hypothetical protein
MVPGMARRSTPPQPPSQRLSLARRRIEMLVEKIDLKNLFTPVCAEYLVPRANAGGWSDINGRAAIMRRFAAHERAGRQCVLLYCGDHDPGGAIISDFLRSNLADLQRAVGWSPDRLIIDRFGLN